MANERSPSALRRRATEGNLNGQARQGDPSRFQKGTVAKVTELEVLMPLYLEAVESELQEVVGQVRRTEGEEFYEMLAYHMGWIGEGAGPQARGKRIRPLLLLLCTAACGGEWRSALGAAAAVELIHNFSLVHDDIQDRSPLRRNRPTLWTIWGEAQAINAGDTLFTLAQLALLRLRQSLPPQLVLEAARLLQETCLALTRGQYLDLHYEKRNDLTEADYWPMIEGKTAALLAVCAHLGALVAGAEEATCQTYHRFGRALGLAFQVLDDLLGIWGDAALTGKSTESDLVSGKKSLPVLYGLGRGGEFARRWMAGPIPAEEVAQVAALLEAEGAREYTQRIAESLTEEALQTLEAAAPQGPAGQALRQLTLWLLQRNA